MRRLLVACVAALLAECSPEPLAAQQHPHRPEPVDRLGTVHFPTSCLPTVVPEFDRGVALLHSFEFGAAIRAFTAVLATDSSCAMAYWGIALSRWTNPMAPGGRPLPTLEAGRRAALEATRLAGGATDRERGYIAAVSQLYDGYEQRWPAGAYRRLRAGHGEPQRGRTGGHRSEDLPRARYALERRAWTETAALQPKASAFLYPEAVTYFARALGASHLADTALARASIDSLAAIRDRLLARGEAYWGEQVASSTWRPAHGSSWPRVRATRQ